MKMSSTYLSSPAPNKTNIFIAGYERTDHSDVESRMKLALFGLCITIAAVTFFGSVFSLLSLLRMRRKTSLCLIVASMSVDDLLSMVPLSLFILQQWDGYGNADSRTLCTLSGLLYVFQGVASNMKAWLIAAYTFYVTKRFGVLRSVRRPFRVMWSIAGVWLVSLAVSVLPLCGWGTFAQSSLGCFPESEGFYVVLLFTLYSLCFCGLLFFFFPLTYQLLCSGEPQTKLFFPRYFEIARAPSKDGSAPLCDLSSLSRDSLNKSFGAFNELSPGSLGKGPGLKDKVDTYTCSTPASGSRPTDVTIDSPAIFAQKRFSMILAVVRIVLWMPMMSLMLVRHIANVRSSALEIISFFMTLLAPTVTPLFALSKRWIHLPCGCFINCQRYPEQDPAAMKRRLEFNLSFQQGYSIYKLSHASKSQHSPAIEKPSYHDLFNCPFPDNQLQIIDGAAASNLRSDLDFRSSHADLLLEAVAGGGEALADHITFPHGDDDERFCCAPSPSPQSIHQRDCEVHNLTDTSSVFEGPERRLSHVECRKIELTDWEWCRSKSERTPRQRSTGGLAIPLCAFQGTVSLQAPTGKTLSLSTYEVSSDGLKISPHNAKKVEVYRSKSVGHEPSADEAASAGQNVDVSTGGMGVGMGMELELGLGGGVGDTNVKIHLEVLEICDNEEAMDSVSIISNISQSSTHARSPSLRYSRRENRFVSCDLGETASYSLLIPTSGNPETDSINISIPDTVEAHRQNSRRQTQENSGYKEEIQLLNEAYRKQTGDREE